MLVVIDCQKQYPAVEMVVHAVVQEVRRAKKSSEWIMLVTYGGRTIDRITRHLRDYHKVVRVTKHRDDGSAVIFDRLFSYHWRNSKRLGDKHIGAVTHLRIAGVNTSACIMKTVDGLRRFVQVTVLSHACANAVHLPGITPKTHHKAALRRMSKWKNVCVK